MLLYITVSHLMFNLCMTALIKLLTRSKLMKNNDNFFEKENIQRVKFVLQPICSEKKSNWMSASFSVVNLTENFDVIGYFPKLTATRMTQFLKRPSNSEKVIIKGKRVNRGGGGWL